MSGFGLVACISAAPLSGTKLWGSPPVRLYPLCCIARVQHMYSVPRMYEMLAFLILLFMMSRYIVH
jgi:hypothetical protein